uniref:uncharacterized protein PFB0765w-like n=1 Tax=Styela clava TaxID=7725 RepID=UPI001939EA2E|nr:uncharacterized protein PFB0765w-like [Styela clava]
MSGPSRTLSSTNLCNPPSASRQDTQERSLKMPPSSDLKESEMWKELMLKLNEKEEKLEEKYDQRLQKLSDDHATAMDKQRSDLEKKLQDQNNMHAEAMQEQKNELEKKLQDQNNMHAEAMQEQKNELEKKLQDQNNMHAEAMQEQKNELENKLQDQNNMHAEAMQEQKNELENKLQDQNKMHAEAMQEQKNELEQTEKQLKDQNARIAEQSKELEKTEKQLKDQDAKIAEQSKELVEVKNKLDTVQEELDDIKDFETMYNKLGGETYFYMDLGKCYKMMKEECKGDKEKLKQLESWYKQKKNMRVKRIGVAAVAGGVFGGMIGGLSLHSQAFVLFITSIGVPPIGVVAIGAGIGFVIVGLSLAAYKAYRNEKMKNINIDNKTQAKVGIENESAEMPCQNDCESKTSEVMNDPMSLSFKNPFSPSTMKVIISYN